MTNELEKLLTLAVKSEASDLHLLVGSPPVLRVHGLLKQVDDFGVIGKDKIESLVLGLVDERQKEKYLNQKELDFSLGLSDGVRFRVNTYYQRGTMAASLRHIPEEISTIDELKLPPICHSFAQLKQGFVLVTGPTGSGKSTTLAAVIDEINRTRSEHIVTIEDPVEFLHRDNKSILSQRELGSDTDSWGMALKSVLRQDPNVVYIGELRDRETMAAAMTVAETGHLVFATLHTNSASQTIERIVDSFSEDQQEQITLQLSLVLEAVLSQRLIPTKDGKLVVASEILIATPAVRNNIREKKSFQIDNVIQTSGNLGMSLMESSLADLVSRNVIDRQTALEYAIRPAMLDKLAMR